MNGFKGTMDEWYSERERISNTYGVTSTRAGCYLSNFCDDFLCRNRHGRGCVHFAECEKINAEEMARLSIIQSIVDKHDLLAREHILSAAEIKAALERNRHRCDTDT